MDLYPPGPRWLLDALEAREAERDVGVVPLGYLGCQYRCLPHRLHLPGQFVDQTWTSGY